LERDFRGFCRVFCRGVGENVVFFDGEFVVSLWWIDGELWLFECMILGAENLSLFEDIFVWNSQNGNADRQGRCSICCLTLD
jgi:hypothetical protein